MMMAGRLAMPFGDAILKVSAFLLAAALAVTPFELHAQTTSSRDNLSVPQTDDTTKPIPRNQMAKIVKRNSVPVLRPFSSIGTSVGIGLMGVNMQVATNLNNYINLRGTGNLINYTDNNIDVSGFTAAAKLNLATGGVGVDLYPFPNHGLRLSAGVLFYNENSLAANVVAAGGTSFTLNDTTYYSSTSNPVQGSGSVLLNTQNPAPTFTVGWGNLIPRNGGHWSVPFELGAAMVGTPGINIALTGGQVCQDPAGTIGCQNVVGDASVNSNLQAQIAKYKNDLDPLRFYPVISVGVGYAFRIRR